MKSINKFCTIFALTVFALTGGNVSGEDMVTADDDGYFSISPVLRLILKVSPMTSSGLEDSLKISEMMARNRNMEQSLWAIIRAETRVYSNEMVESSLSAAKRYGRWYIFGTSLLLAQAREEAHRRIQPYERDSFKSFFGYTDFLYRSNRSIITADGRNQRSLDYSIPNR